MRMNLEGGRIEPGHYEYLEVAGNAQMDDGVTFDMLVVRGRLIASGVRGDVLHVDGTLIASGSIRVGALGGSGTVEAGGGIHASRLQFAGEVRSDEPMRVSTDLAIRGSLAAAAPISAQSIAVEGVLDAQDMHAVQGVSIRPLRTMMLGWQCFRQYDRASSADSIHCAHLDAQDLSCRSVTALTVDLRGNSMVESVRCAERLTMDAHATALQVSGGCSRVWIAG